MQEIATVAKGATSLHGHVPGHLLHPLLVRVNGDPGNVHLAALEVNEKQHVVGHQSAQREDLRREEIGTRQHRQVSPNECCPSHRAFAHWRGRHTVALQNIADRLIRDLMPQIGQRPHNPVIAQDRFSSAMRTINFSTSLLIRGRPEVRRFCEPSNLRATSLRYHAKMVSGRAAVATSPSALRPSRRPISPSFARSASESFSRPFNWPLRIGFSAARYSFRSSSSWSTVPVM